MKYSVFHARVVRRLFLTLALLAGMTAAGVQAQVASQVLVGTVEVLAQDDDYIAISGRNYTYSEETEIFLRGEAVNSSIIKVGMSVRFSVDSNGNLLRIDILGPINMIRLLEQH